MRLIAPVLMLGSRNNNLNYQSFNHFSVCVCFILFFLIHFQADHAHAHTNGYRGVRLIPKYSLNNTVSVKKNTRLVPMPSSMFSSGSGGKAGKAIRTLPTESGSSSASNANSEMDFMQWLNEGFVIEDEDTESSSSSSNNETSNDRRRLNVFGVDDRLLADPSLMVEYPYRCVGKFTRQSDVDSQITFCTGTIIYENLVLTNRHCLGLSSNDELPVGWETKFVFESAFTNGETGSTEFQVSINQVYWSDEEADYAILVVSQDIGKQLGYPGIEWTSLDYFRTERELSMIGFSGDLLSIYDKPSYIIGCKSKGVEGILALHDCDTTKGSSGSPMFYATDLNDPVLIGYNDGEFRSGEVSEFLETFEGQSANTLKQTNYFRSTYEEITGTSTPSEEGLKPGEIFLLGGVLPAAVLGTGYYFSRPSPNEKRNDQLQYRI